jgi:hypothetical protein
VYIVDFNFGHETLHFCHFMDPSTRFKVDIFKSYIQFLEGYHLEICTEWQKSNGSKVEHLVFDVEPTYAFAQCTCKETGTLKFMTREVLDNASTGVKMQLTCYSILIYFFEKNSLIYSLLLLFGACCC